MEKKITEELGIRNDAVRMIRERFSYVDKYLPECEKKANEFLKTTFRSMDVFMSKVNEYDKRLENDLYDASYFNPIASLRHRGISLCDAESFYNSTAYFELNDDLGRNIIYKLRDECEKLIKNKNSAVNILRNINSLNETYSYARETLGVLYNILKQEKAEFDNVCKKIGEFDKEISNLESSFSKISMNNLSTEIANSIRKSYEERYGFLKKEKELSEKERDSICNIASGIRSKMQECVRVLDDIFWNTYTIYTGQNANRNYVVLC